MIEQRMQARSIGDVCSRIECSPYDLGSYLNLTTHEVESLDASNVRPPSGPNTIVQYTSIAKDTFHDGRMFGMEQIQEHNRRMRHICNLYFDSTSYPIHF